MNAVAKVAAAATNAVAFSFLATGPPNAGRVDKRFAFRGPQKQRATELNAVQLEQHHQQIDFSDRRRKGAKTSTSGAPLHRWGSKGHLSSG
jgi:hypothetical protein